MTFRMPDFMKSRPTPTVDLALSALERLGVAWERVELVPVSPLESFKGEVVGQVPHPGETVGDRDIVTFFVARDGLAERLPHEYLEPLPTTQDEAHVAIEPGQVMEFWERQVTAYGPGRQFISVLDKALNRLDAATGRVGVGLGATSDDPAYFRRVLEIVGYDDLPLSDAEASYVASQMYRLYEDFGPRPGMERLMGDLLGLPVTVEEAPGPWVEVPADDLPRLGQASSRIGHGALGRRFQDPQPTLVAHVGPVPLAQHRALDSDPQWHARVRAFLDILAPAGCATDYRLQLHRADRGGRLGDRLRARLGRSTYLT